MREIEFRIYDKQEKKFLIKNQKVKNGDIKNVLMEIVDLEDYSVQINNPYGDRYEFLQYTGFKDANNLKIYEGDIIKENFDGTIVGEVYWDIGEGAFYLGGSTLSEFYKPEMEIIGNIYENPKLREEY